MTESKKPKKEKKFSVNYWMVATFVLAILLIISLIHTRFTGSAVGVNKAGEIVKNYIEDYFESSGIKGDVVINDVEEVSGLYEIEFSVNGRPAGKIALSKDGKYIGQMMLIKPISQNQQTQKQELQNVPKSDKPEVEVFVFSYCPYGLQFEKALLPVYKLLKNKANISLVAIGAMHGEYEKQESLRQICIEKEYGKDKLWSYLEEFMGDKKIGDCRGNTSCLTPLIEKIMREKGIDKNKIANCMKQDAESIYEQQNVRARELGISGSPTFVINGKRVQVRRAPESIKQAICDAFTQEPEECSQTLSTEQASPWFGYSSSSNSGSNKQC